LTLYQIYFLIYFNVGDFNFKIYRIIDLKQRVYNRYRPLLFYRFNIYHYTNIILHINVYSLIFYFNYKVIIYHHFIRWNTRIKSSLEELNNKCVDFLNPYKSFVQKFIFYALNCQNFKQKEIKINMRYLLLMLPFQIQNNQVKKTK
jgi:hypothetical protein